MEVKFRPEQNKILARFLDTVGDGSGTKNGNGNYTSNDKTFVADAASDYLTATSHGFSTGDGPYRLTNSGGDLPTGLSVDTDYWIIEVASNTFQLATSYANAIAGTNINFTSDGTGTHTIHVPTQLILAPSAGEVFQVAEIMIVVEDSNGMQAQEYGNLGVALTNGILLDEFDDNVPNNLIDEKITDNGGWFNISKDVRVEQLYTGSNEILIARFGFCDFGQNIRLVGDTDGKLVVRLNDDLTGLLAHKFFAKGFIEKTAS